LGGELKEKVAQGVAWSMAEKIGSMLLAMAVRLVILRLLTRDILGFMSIPSAVVTVLLVIVDSGFSQSLVRHKGPSQSDYKSVFLFNIAVSAVLYGVLVALAPLAARWYSMPEIARIAPVFFLLLPLNALCAVQAFLVVKRQQVVCHIPAGFFLVGVVSAPYPLHLQIQEEALHRRVVPAVSFPAHAAHHLVLLQQRLVFLTGVLAASV
jgi:hypothetical protein